jgi:acetylglutamate kinase
VSPLKSAREAPGEIASVLVEALPYIRRFSNRIVVVKYGGNALAGADGDESAALAAFAEDVVLLRTVGMLPVIVHGGGPQIGDMLRRLGVTSTFVDGLRVTDAETLEIARMVLLGKVNSDLVAAINVHGPLAVGLSGADAKLLTASPANRDLGFVGSVDEVDTTIVRQLCDQGLIPVVATIGADASGQQYNINADTVAGALAAALHAEKLIMLTDVSGLRSNPEDPSTTLSRVTVAELEQLVADGAVVGGMVPKVDACVHAVRGGAKAAHMLDGRVPHAVLVELFTDGGIGTMVQP